MTELEEKISSLTLQLNEAKDKLSICSSLNQQLENKLQGSKLTIASLTSQLNEARNHSSKSYSNLSESYDKLSEVEKNYKLLSGDHEALSNISLEQCDELIFSLSRSQEKLQQRRVSNEATIFAYIYELNYYTSSYVYLYIYIHISCRVSW